MQKSGSIQKIDFILIGAVILVITIGIIAIYSAGFDPIDKFNNGLYKKQIMWFFIGFVFMLGFSFIDYKILGSLSLHIYGITFLILLLTTFFAPIIRGSRAWISFGFVSIQPSEFMKLATVILLAKYLEIRERDIHNFKELFLPAVITVIPILFIILQSDLGTAMVFIPILFSMLFIGGADMSHIISILVIAFFSFAVPVFLVYAENLEFPLEFAFELYNSGYRLFFASAIFLLIAFIFYLLHLFFVNKFFRNLYIPSTVVSLGLAGSVIIKRFLQGYQKDRILAYLNPELYPHDLGYNVIQSKIAIGSGGLIGKGFLKGTQTQLGFLPETSSDFIFAVIAEEWGMLGSLVLIILLAVIVFSGMKTAFEATDRFGSLLATGITSVFLFHILINIGINLGLFPVTGLPICFVSYGGSNMLMSMIGIGILISIQTRKSGY